MSFFLLSNNSLQYAKKIKDITDKFGLGVQEYYFQDINKTLFMFTWKSSETVHAKLIDNGDFIGSVGTLLYDQYYGDQALSKIYKDFTKGKFKHCQCVGHYNIIIKRQNKVYLYNDILGTWKIYKSNNGLISSSFYLLLELQEILSLDKQGVYEYILNGCTFGEKTIAKQIISLPAENYFICSKAETLKQINLSHSLTEQFDYQYKDIDQLVEEFSSRLEGLFVKYQAIPAKTFRSALSGGYDSRLILSCFLKTGVTPELYVYGKQNDQDVVIADKVAEIAGLKIEFINKSELPNKLTKDNFSLIIERNLFMYDGLSYDGIFDNGNDYYDRLNRSKNNKILVNGSVGEVFRHFYYLPNKDIKIVDFVKSFHSRFNNNTMSDEFNFNHYLENLTIEIKKTLKIKKEKLNRVDVEKLYPLFRARYWSAKDMVNNHRFGPSIYPFFEYNIINGTSTINYNNKLYGRFEGKLINKLSPKLAACMSDYGFSFDSEPLLMYKLKMNVLTYRRPVWLRRISHTIKMNRNKPERPDYLTDVYLSHVISLKFPYMKRFFQKMDMLDNSTMNRLATLEYIAEKYNFIKNQDK